MYEYSIDMFKIIRALERSALNGKESSYISIVPGPLYTGIMDIYPNKNQLSGAFASSAKNVKGNKLKNNPSVINNPEAPIILLYNVIVSKLDSVKLSGINGITGFFATETTIWSLVKAEHKMSKELSENTFSLILNNKVSFSTGLSVNRLIEFLEYLEFKIIQKTPDRLIVQMPEKSAKMTQYYFPKVGKPIPYKSNMDPKLGVISEIPIYPVPSVYINNLAEIDELNTDSLYESYKNDSHSLKPMPVSKFNKLYKYVFAETNGSNLREVLSLDYLDADKIFTNNILEARRILGIEAARNFLIKDLTDSLGSQGSYVDPRHIVFLADYVTNKGLYLSLTFYGLNDQDISYLDKASFERVMDVFIEASVFGKNEEITSATSNVYVGETGKYGTGSVILEVDADSQQKYENEISKMEKISLNDVKFDLENIDLNNLNSQQSDVIDIFAELNDNINIDSITSKSGVPSDSMNLINRSNTDLKVKTEIPKFKHTFSSLPADNFSAGSVQLNTRPIISTPTEYKNNIPKSVYIAGKPVVSNLLANAVSKIGTVPELKISQPIPIPINRSENVLLNSNVQVSVNTLPAVQLNTNIKNSKVVVPEIITISEGSNPKLTAINGLTVSGNSYIPLKSVNGVQISEPEVKLDSNVLLSTGVKITPKITLKFPNKTVGVPGVSGVPSVSGVPGVSGVSGIPSVPGIPKALDINNFLKD